MLMQATLFGSLLVAATVLLHAWGTTSFIGLLTNYDRRRNNAPFSNATSLLILVGTTLLLLILHLIEIMLWAFAYYKLPGIGTQSITTWTDALYFSMVTFTTLGYGDITLTGEARLLTGIQSINGILLFGWSTAMLFLVIQNIWKRAFELKN